MPQLGESIAEATIVRVLVQPGEDVSIDQEIIEVETNKATMGITAMCSGTMGELKVHEGETLPVGSLLGCILTSQQEVERTGVVPLDEMSAAGQQQSTAGTEQSESDNAPKTQQRGGGVLGHTALSEQAIAESSQGGKGAQAHFQSGGESYHERPKIEPSIRGLPVPAGMQGAHYLSPRMKSRMDELGLRASDISAIPGSGAGGRVVIEDLEKFLEYLEGWPSIPASSMRKAVADAMQRSWTRPLASAGMPCNVDALLQHRANSNPKPGLTLYFIRALALAIAEKPSVSGYLVGGKIIHPRTIDIGIATQVNDGVFVPVLREVDKRSLSELMDDYNHLIHLARNRRLTAEQCHGGIATVTNFGGFGLTWAVPIPLPSESIILGVGSLEKKPVWSEQVQTFVPFTVADLVTTFDHRVIDGGDAGRLLARVVELLQRPWEL